ncbi:hypothetical protein GIB67_027233 [Kingdonia uniflora]|uniref:Uncharacterized protein n=1 Tax=Kingdonia uniflora TaxID=39325 RepID=A0A7J7KYD4_9MAGN|nr:hypothetical protein GIB67_027233 [Kingdonia uniflora]
MNRACKVYETCLKNVMQGPISGMQQENLNDATKTIYEARDKGKWLYREAYEVFSCHQCWKILQDQHPDTLTRNETECPGGIKSTKLREKNKIIQNLLIERQNVLISRLDRMEKKKEEYVAERDKKKEEYISEKDKKKEERDARIIELRERKTNTVVNLEAQF